MRRESLVMKQCTLMYKGLKFERKVILHKTKLLLKIYRPVVWSTSNRVFEVCESAELYSSKKMEEALEFLANYAPETEQDKFSDKVRSLFETHWLISLIDNTMDKIYEYPDNGKLYYNILCKQYLSDKKTTENEMLEILNMERSTYYDKKKEALNIFSICLWGYTIPAMRGLFEGSELNCDGPSFFT